MSMSLRIDTADWIVGALVIGATGLGVLGADVPSSGQHGPALLYNDLNLPAEAADEFRALILTAPAAGTLFVHEDSSFTFSGPDGAHTGTYEGFRNGVSYGVAGYTITLGASGGVVAGAIALDDLVTGGSLSGGAATALSGSIALDDLFASGAMAAAAAILGGELSIDEIGASGSMSGPISLARYTVVARARKYTVTE